MKRVHWILISSFGILALTVSIMFAMRPQRVDMTAYAPASSLLYIEANDPLAVVHAVMGTEAWKLQRGASNGWNSPTGWLRNLMRISGIGPGQSVIMSRAQVAVVVTDLATSEEGETLRVKPEFALIIETQTSESRIRSIIEPALQRLAESTYDKPSIRRTLINEVEFIEWRNREASRQIVAAIVGSLVVVGNSEAAVQRCLDTAGKRSPSLKGDSELRRLKRELGGDQALTFGYVPAGKSAQLLAFVVPLLMGRAPGDAGFQKLVTTSAAKLFGSIAWSSKAFGTGIEDRYLIALQPGLSRQLQPVFRPNPIPTPKQIPPENTHSVTYYLLENPLLAWEGLRTSVAANTDAVSAVVFSSLMKSALSSYGLDEPEAFLQTVNGRIATLRLDANGDETLLIAGTKDRDALRKVISRKMKLDQKATSGDIDFFVDPEGETAAALIGDIVIMGQLNAVRRHSQTIGLPGATKDQSHSPRMTAFFPLENTSPIMTFTDDSERVQRFFEATKALGNSATSEPPITELSLVKLPYAATQTKLADHGFERITRSPLGQFSSLLPLVIPEPSNAQNPVNPFR